MLRRDFFEFRKVENIQVGIRRRLGKNEAGVFLYRPVKKVIVSEWNDSTSDSELLEIRPAEFERLFIAVICYNNMVARMDEGKDSRSNCSSCLK